MMKKKRPLHYTLVGKTVVPMETWPNEMEDMSFRRVKLTTLNDDLQVSTVFLGLDHNWGEGAPLVFETMVFNSASMDEYCERCSTWEQAEAQHDRMVNELKAKATMEACKAIKATIVEVAPSLAAAPPTTHHCKFSAISALKEELSVNHKLS